MLLCAVPSFAVLPEVLMCVSDMGELTVWIVFPTVARRMYRDHCHWFHWTAVWLQLHVSLVHVSSCSFAVSQASDLTLLVGYVAQEDFNFNFNPSCPHSRPPPPPPRHHSGEGAPQVAAGPAPARQPLLPPAAGPPPRHALRPPLPVCKSPFLCTLASKINGTFKGVRKTAEALCNEIWPQ